MASRLKVVVTDIVWPTIDIEKRVLAEFGADAVMLEDRREEALIALARDADGILTCFVPVTPRVLEAAPRCQVVGRYGVGVDNISVDAATRLGIVVTYVPDYCIDEVADHALGMLLALNRRLPSLDRFARTQDWGGLALDIPVLRLREATLGIIGLGRIGKAVSKRALALGMKVLACDPYIPDAAFKTAGAEKSEMAPLLQQSDFVTVHTPLNAETRGLIGERELRLMKPTAFLINCARGPIVDEAALIKALQTGRIAGAGLDVLESSHPAPDNPLRRMENVLMTPHTAFFSRQSLLELETRATHEVARVLSGNLPDNIANPEVLGKTRAKLPGR